MGTLLLLLLLPQAAAAQAPPVGSLTLEDCIKLAMAAPSAVTQARQQSEIARYGYTQARAGFLPQARFNSAFTYNSSPASPGDPSSFVALNGNREFLTLLGAGVDLDTSGRLRAGLDRAKADQELAAAGLGIARRDLKRQVTAAYYRFLLARRLVDVAKDALAESRRFEGRTSLLVRNGEVAQADLFKAQSQTAFLDQALNAAELDAQLASQELASFWTASVSDPLDVKDVFDQPVPALESTALGVNPFLQRLELRSLDAEQRGLMAGARQARSALFPQTNLGFQYGLDSNRFESRDRGYAAFFALNVPLWDWFKTRDSARQFELRAGQVQANADIAKRAFSKEYQAALARVQALYRQIGLTQVQVKTSEDNLRVSRVRYEGGEGLALDVVAAMQQLAQARANYFVAQAAYYNARAELEVAAAQ